MGGVTRRQFLVVVGATAACGLGVAVSRSRWWERSPEDAPAEPPSAWSVEARYYTSFATHVRCGLCPNRCLIAEGDRGHCRVRENRGGRLYSMVYGNPCAVAVDPIEKKPFYHFLPSATALSIATAGCNLRCLYCQNWTISQVRPEDVKHADLSPAEVVGQAKDTQAQVIAYTYSEPMVFYEYMLATARLAREEGIRNVVVSNGYINQDPLRELCRVVDAIKIDLKGYDGGFYRRVCCGELEPVLRAIQTIHDMGVHLEIVNLVVPTLNDSLEQLRALARWVTRELSPDVPLHFSRFYPMYKLTNLPTTPLETLERARDIALEEGVRFVYVGNVPGHESNHTDCPACGRRLITRMGYGIMEYNLKGGTCSFCGESIPGVWWPGEPETRFAALIGRGSEYQLSGSQEQEDDSRGARTR